MTDLQVLKATKAERIDKFLSDQFPDKTRSFIQKLIKDEQVTVNGKVVKANYKLKIDDEIEIEIPEPKEIEILPEDIPIDIIYEDQDVLVVNKPKQMVVHPAPGHYSGTLVNALMYHCKDQLSGINGELRPGIVHRIDMDTTGSLVVCKNDFAHQKMSEQLKIHSIYRVYEAIVHGNLKKDEDTIETMIGRHPTDRKKMSIHAKNGRNAITHYKVLERFGNFTHVQLTLETGRTHQIRVHMSSLGHPLLGDQVYGSGKGESNKHFKNLQGQTLHAKTIGFTSPSTGKYIEVSAPLPKYFEDLLIYLRNQN